MRVIKHNKIECLFRPYQHKAVKKKYNKRLRRYDFFVFLHVKNYELPAYKGLAGNK